MKKIIITAIAFFLLGHLSYVDSDVSKRIEGVADFLLERANENIICMFEEKITQNPLIKEYFPNTSKVLTTFDLKILMLNDTLWKYNVEQDLNNIIKILTIKIGEDKTIFSQDKYKIYDDYATAINKASITFKGQNYSLNSIPLDPPEIKEYFINNLNPLYNKIIDIINISQNLKLKIRDINNYDSVTQLIQEIEKTIPIIENWEIFLASNTANLKDIKNLTDLTKDLKNQLNDSIIVLNYAQKSIDGKLNYTQRISNIFYVIEYITSNMVDRSSIKYKNFKNYALFFAQLSDADSKNEAKVVLKTFALPSGSYKSKRKGEMKLSISSYLGLATNLGIYSKGYGGFTTPIGVEYTRDVYNHSVSILGIFFDLGKAVTSKIYSTSGAFELKDIIFPGLAIIWGFPNMPLSWGIGYFQDTVNVGNFITFIAVDIPLFPLF